VKYIYTISGKAGGGKDTFAQFLKCEFENEDKKVCIVHYADYLKSIASLYYNWNGEKDEKGRSLLQKLGTDKVREKSPNYWVNIVKSLIETVLWDDFDIFLIPDARFPNEITCWIGTGEEIIFNSIQVNRDNAPTILTESQAAHPSETALEGFEFDWVVQNKSFDSLRESAKYIIKQDKVDENGN
jgi:hypothetical protein